MVIENVNNNGNAEPLGPGQELEMIDKMLFARSLLDINVSDRGTFLTNALREQTNLDAPQRTIFNTTSVARMNNVSTLDYLNLRKP